MTALDLAAGATTVVVGARGSGKTAVIRSQLMRSEAPVAYQPQQPYLFRGLVGSNLGLGLTAEQCGLAGQYARRLGLESLLAEPAFTATEDEIARVTLARTLARSERLVILDAPIEPIVSTWKDIAIALVREALAGRTALVATKDAVVGLALADRLAMLVDGRITQQGLVEDVVRSDGWPPVTGPDATAG